MHRLQGLSAFLLPSLALAAPAGGDGSWTLNGFRRQCGPSDNSCTYKFSVSDQPSSRGESCQFTIAAGGGRPSFQTDFQTVPCNTGNRYLISGGYDQKEQFIVLTIIDTQANRRAWFGINERDMAGGRRVPTKQSPSHAGDSFIATSPADTEQRALVEDSDQQDASSDSTEYPPPGYGPHGAYDAEQQQQQQQQQQHPPSGPGHHVAQVGESWTAVRVSRSVDSNSNSMTLEFGLLPDMMRCRVHVQAPQGQDIRYYSWYNQPCEGNGWTVSWGYNSNKDSAVATVISPDNARRAWFGWDNVNRETGVLEDAGPNLIHAKA